MPSKKPETGGGAVNTHTAGGTMNWFTCKLIVSKCPKSNWESGIWKNYDYRCSKLTELEPFGIKNGQKFQSIWTCDRDILQKTCNWKRRVTSGKLGHLLENIDQ